MSETKPEAFPFPTTDKHDAVPETVESIEKEPSEQAIDQGVAESFPASDPVSVSITKVERKDDVEGGSDEGERAGPT